MTTPRSRTVPVQRQKIRYMDVETKPFFLTSEFAVAVAAVAGIAITAATSEAFGAWRAWILVSAVTIGYMLARGIAKSGSRTPSYDFRDEVVAKGRD